MAPSSRSGSRRNGTLRAYGPPFWSDPMFWIAAMLALFVGALVVTALLMMLAIPRTSGGWTWTIGLGVLGTWIGFVVLSIGLNTSRGFDRGAAEADRARGDRFEAHGRTAGRFVGRGAARVTGRGQVSKAPKTPTAPDGASPSGDEPTPTITVDRSARVIGQMVGQRMAERRDRKKP